MSFPCIGTPRKILKTNTLIFIMDVEYTWILWHEKNCRQFWLQYPFAFIGRPDYQVGGEGMEEVVILDRYRVHFIIEHENLVHDPSNNKSITLFQYGGRKQCRFKLYTVLSKITWQRQNYQFTLSWIESWIFLPFLKQNSDPVGRLIMANSS